MNVLELWRYPVKSMAGERLAEARLVPDGVAGDRIVQVYGAGGRVLTARKYPKLLGHHGLLGPDGRPTVDGRAWDSPGVAADVRAAAGAEAYLESFTGVERFDILPLLVATDGAIAEFGRDGRRLRPNIILGGVPGMAERNWEGSWLRIGDALIGLQDLRGRCVMTTYDPDTQEQDPGVLRDIVQRFGGKLALNAWVERPGTIRVGDVAEVVESPKER